MDVIMQWLDTLTFWHWMVLGAVLIVIELLAPGIWFLWLGIGAMATGLVVLILADITWQIQAVIFSAFSVVSIIIGRMIMRHTKESENHPMLNRRVEKFSYSKTIRSLATARSELAIPSGVSSLPTRLYNSLPAPR
jgi:hypothetical protein